MDVVEDSQEFYNIIVGIADNAVIENIIKKDADIIFNLIIKNYKNNIQTAALKGFKKSHIFMYNINAKYNELIPVDKYIRMNEQMRLNFERYEIDTIINKVQKRLSPFKIEINTYDDNICITATWN